MIEQIYLLLVGGACVLMALGAHCGALAAYGADYFAR